MARIEDMSETERQSWITLMVDIAVFSIFLKSMTHGFSIETLNPAGLSKLILGLIIITVVLHIIIQSVFAIRTRNEDDDFKDERDLRIEREGATYAYYVMSVLFAIIVGHIVIQNGLNGIPEISDKHQSVFDYTNTSHLVFALTAALLIADIVKNGVMIWAYRRD